MAIEILKGKTIKVCIKDLDGDIWQPDGKGTFHLPSAISSAYENRSILEIAVNWGIRQWIIDKIRKEAVYDNYI